MPTRERPVESTEYLVLPFYLLCDVSYSMLPVIPDLNAALEDFRDELSRSPILADKVRFGVLDFSDTASEVIPLSDFSRAPLRPDTLTVGGSTSYVAGFELLRSTIEKDAKALKAGGMKIYRPAVFFLTDGQPNPGEDWQGAFHRLTFYDAETKQGFQPYPLFVPFGMGTADKAVLSQLVHPVKRSKLYMAGPGTSPAQAIKAMAEAMLLSVVSSGNSVATGTPQHLLPTADQVGAGIEVYEGGDFVDA